MNGKENKRSRGRRAHSNQAKAGYNAASSNTSSAPLSQLLSGLTSISVDQEPVMKIPTDFAFRSAQDDAEKITELMDAPLDFDIPAHAISKGPNPYLNRCMYCNTPRTMVQDEDEGTEFLDLQLDGNTVVPGQTNAQSLGSVKLEIWTCPTCRKVAGNFQSFLEANLPQAACEEPMLSERLSCIGSLSCTDCGDDEGDCRNVNVHAEETKELQRNWVELRTIVKDLHTCTDEPALSHEQGERLKYLIHTLCQKDPHQLFLRLESQVREMVIEIKTGLLQKLNENGIHNPALALDFTSTLLYHYDLITKKAHLLAYYLGGLTDHLKQFQVTWELLNKHLFHSIAHNDPAISSVGPTILEQLRQGSLQYEKSREDPFCSVRKRLLKFQEEMSVVVVVWRDCQLLIENYCQEEFTNTQKQVSHRAKSFITQQRELLKNHLMKDSFMDEETMKSLVSGHKSSKEKVLCHRCKRERCTCDECTITHMITCGIINTEKGTTLPPPPSSFNFALDHTHNVMDITPPSMSSTTSSSGSVSPINVEDKITTYYDCEKVLTEELREAMLSCDGKDRRLKGLTLDDLIDNIDGNAGDDEDDDLDEADNCVDHQDGSDEPHSMQLPMWDTLEAHQLMQNSANAEEVTLSHGTVPHSCAQCHQFQPRIDSQLSKQLEAEIASTGLPSANLNDYVTNNLVDNSDAATDGLTGGNGSGVMNPNICTACQCHACLKQSGHVISTSLPLQVPVSPPPAELNLYPHIHGLPPQRYMFGLPSPLLPSIKLPFKLDLDDPASIHDHLYHAYSDWDNPRPGSLAAQHQHQAHPRLSGLATDLLPPAPVDGLSAFSFEALNLTTHGTQTLTNTSSAFKSVAGRGSENFMSPSINNHSAEGSSVDPATKPLDFSSFLKIPQACLNSSSSSLPLFTSSVPSAVPSSVVSSQPVTTSVSASRAVNGSCHGPPSSRPVPLGGNAVATSKWEKTHSLQCKKFSASGGPKKFALLNQQGEPVNPFSGAALQSMATTLSSVPQSTVSSSKNFFPNHHLKSGRSCPHSAPCPPPPTSVKTSDAQQVPVCQSQAASPQSPLAVAPRVSSSSPSSSSSSSSSSGSSSSSSSSSSSLSTPLSVPTSCVNANANLPSSVVNNIGVGTCVPCVDSECKVHHDDNCDSVDDSCSERSSSTSSNQKEGKYCDCCYCEFFGHNNPQGAKTSPNYFEIKDRLREKLKKKNETKHKSTLVQSTPVIETKKEKHQKAAMEKRGLEELLSYINGTDENSRNKTANKAAKRARQKQRKLDEKARLEHGSHKHEEHHRQQNLTKSLSNFLFQSPMGLESHNSTQQPKSPTTDQERIKELHKKLTQLKEEIKQETTRSSSMIVESTRPTISLAPMGKNGNNIDKVLDMIQQTLKHTQQSQQLSSPNNGKKIQPPVPPPPPAAAAAAAAAPLPTPTPPCVHHIKPCEADRHMNGSSDKTAVTKKAATPVREQPVPSQLNKQSVPPSQQVNKQPLPQQKLLTPVAAQQIKPLAAQQQIKLATPQLQIKQTIPQQNKQPALQQQNKQIAPQQYSKQIASQPIKQTAPQQHNKQTASLQNKQTVLQQNKPTAPQPQSKQVAPQQQNRQVPLQQTTKQTITPSQQQTLPSQQQNKQPIPAQQQCKQQDKQVIMPQHNQSSQASKSSKNQKAADTIANLPNHVRSTAQTVVEEKKVIKSTSASNGILPSKVVSSTTPSNGINLSKGSAVKTEAPAVSTDSSRYEPVSTTANASNKETVISNGQNSRSGKSPSESPSSRAKASLDQTKGTSTKSKKNKKKVNYDNGDIHDPDEVFMPRSESELDGTADDFERELEEFKRFCFETSEPPKEKRKLAVNVNLKDIFKKKTTFA